MPLDSQRASWPGWDTVRKIGSGGFGAVYEIKRDLFGDEERAALKVISIPQNAEDLDEMYNDGYDEESITTTFQGYLKSIVAEYSMMRKLSDCPYIVSCDDVRYVQQDNGIGWDVYIKMELLTPVMKALPGQIPDTAAAKLGRDLCTALVACSRHGILHRDIKPQNIFISGSGDYKLGDFGIAKAVEKTMGGTRIGTYKYMAPEVYNNQPYGAQADIYSLGLVLYWMLNERRMPFLPLPPEKLTAGMDEHARLRRLSGEKLPPPAHGSAALKRIVLKACAYDPALRYCSAADMLRDLDAEYSALSQQIEYPSVPASHEPAVPAWPSLDETVILSQKDPDIPFREETVLLSQQQLYGGYDETVCLEEPAPPAAPVWIPCREELSEEETMLIFGGSAEQSDLRFNAGQKERAEAALKQLFREIDQKETSPVFGTSFRSSDCQRGLPADSTKHFRYISAGENHAAAILADGSVFACGDQFDGKCSIQHWQQIMYICCGDSYTLGLHANGTVRLAGTLAEDQDALMLRQWRNIALVASSPFLIAGLNSDGQVQVCGMSPGDRKKVKGWKDVTAVDVGNYHLVGLRSDGTLLWAGSNDFNQCGVGAWCGIVSAAAGGYHTVACKDNGKVLSTGNNSSGQCDTNHWQDIISVKAGGNFSLGLKKDGTVLAAGGDAAFRHAIADWSNIHMISAGNQYAAGYRKDGSVCVAALTKSCQDVLNSLMRI